MKIKIIVLMLFCQNIFGQAALYNYGNMQIHEGGAVGFHTDLKSSPVFGCFLTGDAKL